MLDRQFSAEISLLHECQMLIKESKTDIKTIRPGDPLWNIKSGMVVAPRAGFEISNDCPTQYMQIIQHCYQQGWLKPIAQITGTEATLEYLKL